MVGDAFGRLPIQPKGANEEGREEKLDYGVAAAAIVLPRGRQLGNRKCGERNELDRNRDHGPVNSGCTRPQQSSGGQRSDETSSRRTRWQRSMRRLRPRSPTQPSCGSRPDADGNAAMRRISSRRMERRPRFPSISSSTSSASKPAEVPTNRELAVVPRPGEPSRLANLLTRKPLAAPSFRRPKPSLTFLLRQHDHRTVLSGIRRRIGSRGPATGHLTP